MTPIAAAAITDPHAIEEFCLRWGTAWNEHDGEAVAALCAEDLVYDEPALGGRQYGRAAIRDFVAGLAVEYPDNVFTLTGLYADLRRRAVLVAWTFTGTHAATSRQVRFHGDDRLEFGEDGLIQAYRCLYDNELVLRQVGKRPA